MLEEDCARVNIFPDPKYFSWITRSNSVSEQLEQEKLNNYLEKFKYIIKSVPHQHDLVKKN